MALNERQTTTDNDTNEYQLLEGLILCVQNYMCVYTAMWRRFRSRATLNYRNLAQLEATTVARRLYVSSSKIKRAKTYPVYATSCKQRPVSTIDYTADIYDRSQRIQWRGLPVEIASITVLMDVADETRHQGAKYNKYKNALTHTSALYPTNKY